MRAMVVARPYGNFQAAIIEDSVSRQSSIDLFRYGWIHLHFAIIIRIIDLHPAIAMEHRVSRQSSRDLVHLHSAKA